MLVGSFWYSRRRRRRHCRLWDRPGYCPVPMSFTHKKQNNMLVGLFQYYLPLPAGSPSLSAAVLFCCCLSYRAKRARPEPAHTLGACLWVECSVSQYSKGECKTGTCLSPPHVYICVHIINILTWRLLAQALPPCAVLSAFFPHKTIVVVLFCLALRAVLARRFGLLDL